jgi:hypothetical protein
MEHTMKCEHPNCNVSEGELETAKRLNMHPEDFHYMMDVHMEVLAELAKKRRKQYAEAE